MLDASLKATLVKKYPTEQVFVVPFEQTKRIPDGFTPAQNLKVSLGSWGAKGRFIFRHDAEYNPTVQQFIPYILVMNQDGSKVFVTERIAGEELHHCGPLPGLPRHRQVHPGRPAGR